MSALNFAQKSLLRCLWLQTTISHCKTKKNNYLVKLSRVWRIQRPPDQHYSCSFIPKLQLLSYLLDELSYKHIMIN